MSPNHTIGVDIVLCLNFREEKRGLAWVEELPQCPGTFSSDEKLRVLDDGQRTWAPLAQARHNTRLYCMTSRSVSKSGFQQRVTHCKVGHFFVVSMQVGQVCHSDYNIVYSVRKKLTL